MLISKISGRLLANEKTDMSTMCANQRLHTSTVVTLPGNTHDCSSSLTFRQEVKK